MLDGNGLLHGWYLSDVSFITTELPQYALLVWMFGPAHPHRAHRGGDDVHPGRDLLGAAGPGPGTPAVRHAECRWFRPNDIRHLDLRPSAIRHSYYETQGRVVKYYENI